jgi:hypothetical protein
MKQRDEIVVLTDAVLITCIVQRGVADNVVDAATEAGAQGATIFYARGYRRQAEAPRRARYHGQRGEGSDLHRFPPPTTPTTFSSVCT